MLRNNESLKGSQCTDTLIYYFLLNDHDSFLAAHWNPEDHCCGILNVRCRTNVYTVDWSINITAPHSEGRRSKSSRRRPTSLLGSLSLTATPFLKILHISASLMKKPKDKWKTKDATMSCLKGLLEVVAYLHAECLAEAHFIISSN